MLLPGNCTSLDAVRREGKEESLDERIRSTLERKNVTVVRPQGEEKLAVARHWPKPRRRFERSLLRRFLFARTCCSARRGCPRPVFSPRFSSLLPHTVVARTPLSPSLFFFVSQNGPVPENYHGRVIFQPESSWARHIWDLKAVLHTRTVQWLYTAWKNGQESS